jgi:hypothetical protein
VDVISEPRVELIGKPGCHLCEVARDVVETVCAEMDLDHVEVNIYDDPFSADRYVERIPVVLVDGVEVAQFRISADRLRRALADG